MITVVCVLKDGGIYNQSHVTRLRKQLIGRINQPFQFVCLNDSPYPGFWSKISLFEPGRFKGRVLYLDLDVTITGDLDEIIDFPWPFGIIRDWFAGVNSSVMVWDAGIADHLYTDFHPNVMKRLHGDQNWVGERMLSTVKFPAHWCVSYKKHVKPIGKVPCGTKVVVYHGLPKPWDVKGV